MATDKTTAAAKTTTSVGEKLKSLTPLQYSASIGDIEKAIFAIEGVRVIFRAPSSRRIPGLGYDYMNKLKSGTVDDLVSRIDAVFKACGDIVEFAIVDGAGRAKFPATWKLDKIRATYSKPVVE